MELTQAQKVQALYKMIGDRGLYVNSNFDIFTQKPEDVQVGAGYKVQLLQHGTNAYSSPMLFATLTCLLNHGTMMFTGAPGIGKTTGAEFAGHFFAGMPLEDILASEIQGNVQLTEEKMVAYFDIGKLTKFGERVVIPTKFLKSSVKIIDEVNRAPADVLSILLRLVDTGIVVYGGELLKAVPGPLFVTANYADEGTFELTPPFLDRFDVAVMVASPQPWDLRKIRERGDEKLNGGIEPLLVIPPELALDFTAIRKQINTMPEKTENEVPLVSTFADFIYGTLRFSEAASDSLARSTKGNAWQVSQENFQGGHFKDDTFNCTVSELSIRTVKAIQRYSKAFAWFSGRESVELSDLKAVLPYMLWHKVKPTSLAMRENQKYANDRIAFVEDLVARIETDYQEVCNSKALKQYSLALSVIETGKMKGEDIDSDSIREIVRNAIKAIGDTDKPWALTLANHISSSYNSKFGGQ